MRDFMADDDADAAEIGTARSLSIIERRLKDSGRNGDAVIFRDIGGVDVLRGKSIPLVGIKIRPQKGVNLLPF